MDSARLPYPTPRRNSWLEKLKRQGLSHWFGEGETRIKVLDGINLTIQRGEFVVLMGPSGSGKTTLLTLMGSLREVQTGSVRLLGEELRGATERTRVRTRRSLGFIFQAHNLHLSLTATQNVLMGLEVLGRPSTAAQREQDREAAHRVLRLVGLGDRLDYLPAQLSGGQKQRVAVARALVGNPQVVLADEPTAALDKVTSAQVVDLLRRLGKRRGTSTVVVTHDPRILDRADRIISLEDGRLVDPI